MSHLLKQLVNGEFGVRCPNIEVYYREFPDVVYEDQEGFIRIHEEISYSNYTRLAIGFLKNKAAIALLTYTRLINCPAL